MTEFVLPPSTLTLDRAVLALWSRWPLLAKIGGLFSCVGVIYALLAPVEYESGASLMPEFQAGSAGNLKQFGALADLVGVGLGSVNSPEAVRPDLYPDVLTSTPFLLTVLNQPVTTVSKKTYPTLVSFLAAKPTTLTAWLDVDPLVMPKPDLAEHSVRLSKEQEDVLKDLQKRIVSRLDPQSGLITIRVKMPDAEVAAQICQQAISYLRKYVIGYRTDKTHTDLTFVSQRLAEAKIRYNRALDALSAYSDQNQFLYTQKARVAGKRLESEYELAQNLYNDLSRQYEQTRLKIQEQTPVLSVLEPPKVPARRSEPRRTITVLIFAAVGLAAGAFWILGKELVSV